MQLEILLALSNISASFTAIQLQTTFKMTLKTSKSEMVIHLCYLCISYIVKVRYVALNVFILKVQSTGEAERNTKFKNETLQ